MTVVRQNVNLMVFKMCFVGHWGNRTKVTLGRPGLHSETYNVYCYMLYMLLYISSNWVNGRRVTDDEREDDV